MDQTQIIKDGIEEIREKERALSSYKIPFDKKKAAIALGLIVLIIFAIYIFPKKKSEIPQNLDTNSIFNYKANKKNPEIKEKMLQAAKAEPATAFNNYPLYKNAEFRKNVLIEAIRQNPSIGIEKMEVYQNEDFAEELQLFSLNLLIEKSPLDALALNYKYKDKSYAKEIRKKAIMNEITNNFWDNIIYNLEKKKIQKQDEIYIEIAEISPVTAAYNFNSYEKLGLSESSEILRTIKKYKKNNNFRLFYLIDPLMKNEISIEKAEQISKAENSKALFSELVKLRRKEIIINEFDVELELMDTSRGIIGDINDLHEKTDYERFKSVEDMNSEELYTLMSFSENTYTSTFRGLYKRLESKMVKEKINGFELIKKNQNRNYKEFIGLASAYGKLEPFIITMNKNQKKELLEKFIEEIPESRNRVDESIAIADVMFKTNDRDTLEITENKLIDVYENTIDPESKKILGIIASSHSIKATSNKEWYNDKSKEYNIPKDDKIESSKLLENNNNIQQYFFYDDRESEVWDGHLSFASFLNQYGFSASWNKKGDITKITKRSEKGYSLEEKDGFIIITTKENNKELTIYANTPDKEIFGTQKVFEEFNYKGIKPSVGVHRGHSYHLDKTIKKLSPSMQIVSLGSCGGFRDVKLVNKYAPNAHIISTQGTGTMAVNDPLFKLINDDILNGKDIVWDDIWSRAKQKISSPDFKEYIPPNENVAAIFLKAYSSI